MIASAEMDAFFREGLARYAPASDAVETFEREVQERLLRTLEGKDDWRNFRPRRGERGRGKALSSGTWSGATGRTIFAFHQCAAENDGYIDLKLWWGSPRARDGVLICAGRWDAGYRPRHLVLADPAPPIVCAPIDQGKAYLFAPLGADGDVERLGRLMLDELDRALG